MATKFRAPVEEHETFTVKPRRDVDRKALRASINARYENTLRYLRR